MIKSIDNDSVESEQKIVPPRYQQRSYDVESGRVLAECMSCNKTIG